MGDDQTDTIVLIAVIFVCIALWLCIVRKNRANRRALFLSEGVPNEVDGKETVDSEFKADANGPRTPVDVELQSKNYQEIPSASMNEEKPRRSRLALASHFSAAMAQQQADDSSNLGSGHYPIPQSQRNFHHKPQANEDYVWPSKGGAAVPIHVDWGAAPAPLNETSKRASSTQVGTTIASLPDL